MDIAAVLACLQKIAAGKLCLEGELNEEYDDWYDDCGDEFLFEDPKGVLSTMEKACELVHRCVDAELYQEGYELFSQLWRLEVTVEGSYCEYMESTMGWKELLDNGLIEADVRQLMLDALYLAYKSLSMEERSRVLFEIFDKAGTKLTLEALLQAGDGELPYWTEFLPHWIDYLGSQAGDTADRLLTEALEMQSDDELFIEMARKYAVEHPQLYEQLLQQGLETDGRDAQWEALGEEALQKIPQAYRIRSRAALWTSVYALRQNRQEAAQGYWLEAFRSDTSLANYLRLRLESRDFAKYRDSARRIYEEQHEKHEESGVCIAKALRENRLSDTVYYGLCFFDGEFHRVLDEAMNVKEALGWSCTFMKTGLALFLLLLYEGDELPPSVGQMCSMAEEALSFRAEEYIQGVPELTVPETGKENNISFFGQCVSRWKKATEVPEEEKEKLLARVEQWIEQRTEGIMHNTRRNYYGECADFIAALGEVRESRGVKGAKERVLQSYRARYPRHSAFHQELRARGMQGTGGRW